MAGELATDTPQRRDDLLIFGKLWVYRPNLHQTMIRDSPNSTQRKKLASHGEWPTANERGSFPPLEPRVTLALKC
jgi:hypothetical protein